MPDDTLHDLIIVGGGPGGLSAGVYAIRAALKTVLLEKGAPGGQVANSAEVENYLGFEYISGGDLAMKFLDHATNLGLEVEYEEVAAIEPGLDHHTVVLNDGRRMASHAVILATGGQPRKLQVPGEKDYYGQGVSYCGVCDGFFFRDKTVVVAGGGDTAAEEALYLAKLASKVYLVHRRDELRASMILQKRVFDDCNIDVLWNSVITRIEAGESGVRQVQLQDTQTGELRDLATDGVFIFIGFIPDNQLVPAGIKRNAEGYVVTDERCQTNIAGIYVVGDLREKYARQIVIAAADGCTAALAAAHYVEMKKSQDADACELPQHLSA